VSVAKGKELTLVAAVKPQLKKQARRDWSKAKAERFLGVLAETCNVSEACRQTGISMTVVYRRRKMDAKFRAAWNETLSGAYSRLELVLLDRAFNGTEKVMTRHDGSEDRMREYPNHIALRLLQMHRETVSETQHEMAEEDVNEIRERLVRKLQRMKKRDAEQEQGQAGGAGIRRAEPRTKDSEGCVGGAAAQGDLEPECRTGPEI
jgi:hypothetical protein